MAGCATHPAMNGRLRSGCPISVNQTANRQPPEAARLISIGDLPDEKSSPKRRFLSRIAVYRREARFARHCGHGDRRRRHCAGGRTGRSGPPFRTGVSCRRGQHRLPTALSCSPAAVRPTGATRDDDAVRTSRTSVHDAAFESRVAHQPCRMPLVSSNTARRVPAVPCKGWRGPHARRNRYLPRLGCVDWTRVARLPLERALIRDERGRSCGSEDSRQSPGEPEVAPADARRTVLYLAPASVAAWSHLLDGPSQ